MDEYTKGRLDAYADMENYAAVAQQRLLAELDRKDTEDALLEALISINDGLESKIGNVIIFKGGHLQ